MVPQNYKQLLAIYNSCPKEIQDCFSHLPKLIQEFPYKVSIGYLFSEVEYAHRMSIYCGLVKILRIDTSIADRAISTSHLTREEFPKILEGVFGKEIPGDIQKLLKDAEKVRDKTLHGQRNVTESELRMAVNNVLDYAAKFNHFTHASAGFKPFGSLQGFAGRNSERLNNKTARLVLKGLGFHF